MEKLWFEIGIYLPIFVLLSALVAAFTSVMTENLQENIRKRWLSFVSIPMSALCSYGILFYLCVYVGIHLLFSLFFCMFISAVIIIFSEEFFRKIIKKSDIKI